MIQLMHGANRQQFIQLLPIITADTGIADKKMVPFALVKAG
jgi:hypothetical protein